MRSAVVPGYRFTNGVDQRVTALASSRLNNLATPTVVMWTSITTAAPAAQRNFFGKSFGNHNWVGFINSTTLNAQYGDPSGTSASVSVTFANLPYALVANRPVCLSFQNDAATAGNNLIGIGYADRPLALATTYSTQRAAGGSGHDDSASRLIVGNAGLGGTSNTLPGAIYSIQVFNRTLSLSELRMVQNNWLPRFSGCVLAWRPGRNGPSIVVDESGCGHYGIASGTPATVREYGPEVYARTPTQYRRVWSQMPAASGFFARYYYDFQGLTA